jgi:hypothetical protein
MVLIVLKAILVLVSGYFGNLLRFISEICECHPFCS